MIHVTPQMAAAVASSVLAWYADLLARGIVEFTVADFPAIPERTLRYYIAQLRHGWCDIRVVRRGKPTLYGLPPAQDPGVQVADPAERAAFVAQWQARPEAQALPAFTAAEYEALRLIYPSIPTADFERCLLSKLVQSAGSPDPSKTTSGLVQWLTTGIGLALRASTTPPGADPSAAGRSPDPLTPDYEYDRYAAQVMAKWRPPWLHSPATPPRPNPYLTFNDAPPFPGEQAE
jgi:hypothetical protein